MRGLFITLEGIEGSGKSTQLALLARRLRRERIPVITTREPGGTSMGNKIRTLLLDVRNTDLRAKTELFLYLAGRSQHVQSVIQPALANGMVVLCDRFSDATLAYQGHGRRLITPLVRRLVDYAADGLQPDLTLLLDIDPRTALRRVRSRRGLNRFDREALAFYTRVRQGYRRLAAQSPRRIVTIDGRPQQRAVALAIERVVRRRLHPARLDGRSSTRHRLKKPRRS